jgi:hypothetical protein
MTEKVLLREQNESMLLAVRVRDGSTVVVPTSQPRRRAAPACLRARREPLRNRPGTDGVIELCSRRRLRPSGEHCLCWGCVRVLSEIFRTGPVLCRRCSTECLLVAMLLEPCSAHTPVYSASRSVSFRFISAACAGSISWMMMRFPPFLRCACSSTIHPVLRLRSR